MKRNVIVALALLFAGAFFLKHANASVGFSINFDNGFNADTATGDKTAYTDNTLPSLVTGLGGNGKAIKNSANTSLKYKTSNLNNQKDSISFDFQLPFDLNGDKDKGKVADVFSQMTYDPTTDYSYVADTVGERLIRTKMDGTGWQSLGSFGYNTGQFSFDYRGGVAVDQNTQFIYIADSGNHRIVKTKIDGSGWDTYGSIGAGVDQFYPTYLTYNQTQDELYFIDGDNNRLVKTKFGGEGWATYDLSGISEYPRGLSYDNATELFYTFDAMNKKVVRFKIDGSSYAEYGSAGSGINQFSSLSGLYFDDGYLYLADTENYRIIKTQFGGTGWQTYGSRGAGVGKFYLPYSIYHDAASDFIYVMGGAERASSGNLLIKTRINGVGWQGYATQGINSTNDVYDMVVDESTNDYYIAGYANPIIKTQKDGSGWQPFGNTGNGVTPGTFSYITGIDYDSTNGDVYVIDHYINGIIKTKMDGTGWTVYKGPNGDDFATPRGLAFDQINGDVYAGAMYDCAVVKTKMDGTGWDKYGTCGTAVGQFGNINSVKYDDATGWVYVSSFEDTRLIRFKMDQKDASWQVLDVSAWNSWGVTFTIEPGTDYVYIGTDTGDMVRVKMDGTNASTISSSTWPGVYWAATYPIAFEKNNNVLVSTDYRALYRSTPNGELIERITLNTDKVLFKTNGTNPLELSLSSSNGKFGLSLNRFLLPLEYSAAQTMVEGSWHNVHISYDRLVGTMYAYLDGNEVPFISKTGIGEGSDIGEYFYLGSDPTDPNRNFPGLIDNLQFGLADPLPNVPALTELPATGTD